MKKKYVILYGNPERNLYTTSSKVYRKPPYQTAKRIAKAEENSFDTENGVVIVIAEVSVVKTFQPRK